MHLAEQLLFLLTAIYVGDCLWWVPRNAWILYQPLIWKDQGRLHIPHQLGNGKNALHLLSLFPGRYIALELREDPLSTGSEGWSAWQLQNLGPAELPEYPRAFQSYSEEEPHREQSRLYQGKEAFVQFGTEALAQDWLRFLRSLAPLSKQKRMEAIETRWQHSIDADAIRERWEELQHTLILPRSLGTLHVLSMFVGLPFFCLRMELTPGLITGGSLVLFMTLLCILSFARAHKRLYPEAKGERWGNISFLLFSFPHCSRIADLLSRRAFQHFQAPAVLCSLFPAEPSYKDALQAWWRDLQHPLRLPEDLPEDTQKLLQEVAQQRKQRWHAWWEQQESKWTEADPREPPPEGRPFCPRCLVDFDPQVQNCPDCPDVKLQPTETWPFSKEWEEAEQAAASSDG